MKSAAELWNHTESCLPSFSFGCEIQGPVSKVLEPPVLLVLSQQCFHFKNQIQTLMKWFVSGPFLRDPRHKCRHEFWESSRACGMPHELVMSDRCLDAVMHAQTPTLVFGIMGTRERVARD